MKKSFIISVITAIAVAVLLCSLKTSHTNEMFNSNLEALSRGDVGTLTDCYTEDGEFELVEYVYYYRCGVCKKVRFFHGAGEVYGCFIH